MSRSHLHLRTAALTANSLFALTLAIVAGLIFAWIFKVVVLDARPRPTVAASTVKLTVAAVNILDKSQIQANQVKTITLTEAEYNTRVREARLRVNGTDLLVGNQPINRTTLQPIRAEEPIFENQLEPLRYPEPVSSRLRPGKRAVILEIPSTAAMVQVDDHVDVLCTLSNDYFGSGPDGTRTAVVVKNARVIARFNTTQTAGRPPPQSATRTYTLEVNPYRYGLIELAKSFGARFALSVSERLSDEGSILRASTAETTDPESDLVTRKDLDRLFGLERPEPEKRWVIERYSGTKQADPLIYNYSVPPLVPEKPAPRPVPPASPIRPAVGTPISGGAGPGVSAAPASNEHGYPKGAINWRAAGDQTYRPSVAASARPVPTTATYLASSVTGQGYRAPPNSPLCVGPG